MLVAMLFLYVWMTAYKCVHAKNMGILYMYTYPVIYMYEINNMKSLFQPYHLFNICWAYCWCLFAFCFVFDNITAPRFISYSSTSYQWRHILTGGEELDCKCRECDVLFVYRCQGYVLRYDKLWYMFMVTYNPPIILIIITVACII